MPGPAGSPFSGGGASISIDMPGLTRILGKFKTAGAGLSFQMEHIEDFVAADIAAAARKLVAKDSHKTEKSVRVERRDGDAVVVVDRGDDKPEVPIYLEIGTYKMAARPFLKPAGDLVMASRGLQRAALQAGGLLPPTARR